MSKPDKSNITKHDFGRFIKPLHDINKLSLLAAQVIVAIGVIITSLIVPIKSSPVLLLSILFVVAGSSVALPALLRASRHSEFDELIIHAIADEMYEGECVRAEAAAADELAAWKRGES